MYLVFKINQNHIDPLPLFKISQLKGILDRDEVKVPNQLPGEGEPEYTERLRQVAIIIVHVFDMHNFRSSKKRYPW